MEISGKIKVINPEQFVSATFKKRELVVVTDEQYPQTIMVEFTQDKCDLLSAYQPGQDVKVSINLRGREWVSPQGETRYFNSIQGWRIEKIGNQSAVDNYQQRQQAPAAETQTNPQQSPGNFNEEEHDDLPF